MNAQWKNKNIIRENIILSILVQHSILSAQFSLCKTGSERPQLPYSVMDLSCGEGFFLFLKAKKSLVNVKSAIPSVTFAL